jgi:glycopeptide antibiotics resistance protein
MALVVYGSLVPLHFRFVPLEDAVAQYHKAMSAPLDFKSRSDWAANILLFIPLGFLLMGFLAVDRPARAGWVAALFVLPTCSLLSGTIEFAQLYFPPRVTALNDVVAESLGGLIGTTIWLVAGQRITSQLRQFWGDLGGPNTAKSLLPAYLIFLVLVHAMPMDLTISPVEIIHKYREGRVLLIPFARWKADPFGVVQKCLTNMAFFLPAGMLLTGLSGPFWQRTHRWPAILGLGLGLASLIECMQLCVYTRFFDSTDILTGGIAVLAGWFIGLACQRVPLDPSPRVANEAGLQSASTHTVRRYWSYGVLGGWLALLIFVEWQPFNFNLSLSAAASRLRAMSVVPFNDYQQANYLDAFDQICAKIVLFLPIGAILAWVLPKAEGFSKPIAAFVAGIFLTTLLEGGQLFLPTRYASITDILIETFGVWLGFVAARRALIRS